MGSDTPTLSELAEKKVGMQILETSLNRWRGLQLTPELEERRLILLEGFLRVLYETPVRS